ncbi:MAG TPA: copper resistance protein B [Candidatus Binatia bacterium]|nr:copper resistance protein B [Candidatus Binatia bacterium]
MTELDTGLRLRYEFSRKFAPYLGVEYDSKCGDTATFAHQEGESSTTYASSSASGCGTRQCHARRMNTQTAAHSPC